MSKPVYVLTLKFGDDGPEPCDCPICQVMGISLADVDRADLREVTPDQLKALLGLMDEEKRN